MSGPVDVLVEDLYQALRLERHRSERLWEDLQQAFRALAVADDQNRDLRAEVERLQLRLAALEAGQ